MTEEERKIFERALKQAYRRLVYANEAPEGTAVHESVPSIQGQIDYLVQMLANH